MFATIDLTRATLAVLAIAAACSVRVQAPGELADDTVFVDRQSQEVFLKQPGGWKFMGKAEGAFVGALPGTVVTSLPAAPGADTQVAMAAR
jgi:hypothetical protein